MPLTRYQIRNEYGLADPELYKAAERDDPEALLEGVAMAGLVGVLRQLGDLAEFAAEIFHGLHEEVMATAARGHGLVARVQQLEADFPSIEKAFLSRTNHSPFFSAPGVNWHPNLQSDQNLVTRGDLPRFVMDSYEECRGPPRLFLLDKFDVAGAGACLKRYTDPSFFKGEAKSHELPTGDVQREKKMRKVKKKAARVRNGETSGMAPTSHAKLHQLLMEERIESGYNDPARAVKLKKRHLNGYPFDSETGKSFMVKFAEAPSPEHKVVHEVPYSPPRLKFRSSNTSETTKDVHEINTVNHVRNSPQRHERSCSPPSAPEEPYKPSPFELKEEAVDRSSEVAPIPSSDGETDEVSSSPPEVMDKKIYAVGGEGEKEGSVDGYPSDDVTSEVDNYMDALTTMDSELETDNEHRIKNDLGFLNLEKHGMGSDAYEEQPEFQTDCADFQSVANSSASDYDNHSFKKVISSNSYSDTSSNLTENMPCGADGAGKVSPSNEPCIAAFMETPSNKLSTSETLESKSYELVVPNDMSISEVKIPDTVETSPSNRLSISEISEPKSDKLLLPYGPETNLASSSDGFPGMPSQNGDHSLFALSDETIAVDKLDDGGTDVISVVPLYLPNVSEGAHGRKVSDHSGNEVLRVTNTDSNYCTEKFDSGEIGSPHSVSPTDEQLICSALPEVAASSGIKSVPASLPVSIVSSDYLKLADIATEIDNVTPSTEANLENVRLMVDVPETRNSTQEGVPLEVPCNYSNHTDCEDHVKLDDMITEMAEAEDVALSSTSADRPDGGVSCALNCSSDVMWSARNLASSHECSSDLEDHQKGLEFNEEISPGCLAESEVKQEVNQLEFASSVSDSAPQKSVPYKESKLEIPDDAEDVSVTEQDQNSLHDGDATTTSTPSQQRNQVPEAVSPHPDNLLENSEDALPSSTSLQETEVLLQQFSRLEVDQVHIENMQVDKEQLQSPTYRDQELHSDVSESSPECLNQATLLELSHTSPASCPVDLSCQSSLAESIPQLSIQEADGTKQAIDLTDTFLHNFGVHPVATEVRHSAESRPDTLPWQLSSSELLQPASQVNQGTQQAMDRSDASLPFFGIFPEATPGHLEMPPLPPLPPMQWRMGRVHNAPFSPLKEALQCSQDSCNPALSSAANNEVELRLLPGRGMLQPQKPFVPHTAEEDERSRHGFTHLDGNSVQLTQHSLQMSNMFKDPAGEVRQSQDSFPTLPTISDDRGVHAFHISGGEIIQSGNISLPVQDVGDATSGHDPVSSQSNLMQPLNRLLKETAADDKMLQHVSQDLEGQGDASLNAFASLGSTENGQPQNGLPATGGEIAWYPKTSAFVPFFEVPKPNGNSTVKIPRPRSPLIDAVAAHDKSTLRRVTERVRPQIEPKSGERDSLLEQIRTKSFNLKPAPVTRPSIQGPKTNLKVAAILEKANAIRQALAGSDDDDDDADSWSDS